MGNPEPERAARAAYSRRGPTGDLIQQIEHNAPEGSTASSHETWNVISRNTQEVVTGIYLWQVSSPLGDQVGKLVIIK